MGGGDGGAGHGAGTEESLTSKEFEKFLAERAAVAETLPTISSSSTTSPATTAKDRKKKSDETDGLLALWKADARGDRDRGYRGHCLFAGEAPRQVVSFDGFIL